MDNRLIFLYYHSMFERSRDTGGYSERAAGSARPSEIDSRVVKYARRFEGVTGRENKYRSEDSTLARKAAIEWKGTRTANRHRWMRRES
jgi:hypothetical protein